MRLKVLHCSMWILFFIALGIGGFACKDQRKAASHKKHTPTITQKSQPEEIPATPAGQLALAIKYYTGEGKPKAHKKAAKYFKMAADNGSHQAQFALGCIYQNGHGVTQNFVKAADYYLKAAQADNPNAQFLLGLSYKEGSGVPRDPLESYKWIFLAAEAGKTQHIAARQQLDQTYSPAMITEGRRRADQFRMYQGVNN
ncbi:MAG: tetratricopeptide repeat protein [Verrucomicrobiota bacterium]|nr:tetratricopeptide repeat protein [Verrucomicrobiota bacterium]